MKNDIKVENLLGLGMKAVVTQGGKQYATYNDFARAAGYPESVYNDVSAIDGEKVSILAKGNHGRIDDTIYVVENSCGERYLIGAEGVEIFEDPEKRMFDKIQAEMARMKDEIADLKSEVAVLVGYRYEQLERKHLGDYEKETGIYAKSPQQIRDEIVAKAKADVAEMLDVIGEESVGFSVNSEKRTVAAYAKKDKQIFARLTGIAKADPSDCFNVHIGKAIALRRALGLEVPAKYYNAPAPTEVRVGDVVRTMSSGKILYEGKVERVIEKVIETVMYDRIDGMLGEFSFEDGDKIIDDSRE